MTFHLIASSRLAPGLALLALSALPFSCGHAQGLPATPPAAPASSAADPSTPNPSAAAAAQAAPVAPSFDVMDFAIEGNTVLPVEAVEQAVTPFLGPHKTLADVEAARAALEKTYQDRGYLTVFVDLPEQSTAGGVITLKVLEGRVERLAVTGSHYYSQGYIRNHVTELAEGKVPNFGVVQAQLAQVNRSEDRQVQPVLKPGADPGTVDAELMVKDQVPLHGTVELNNNNSPYTRPLRLQTALHYDNLFQSDQSLTVAAITAPQDLRQSRVFSGEYVVPNDAGDSWHFSGLFSDSNVSVLSSSTILGHGYDLGIKRQLALPGAADLVHAVSLGLDFKVNKQRILAGGDAVSDPVKYAPLSAGYSAYLQAPSGALTVVNVNTVLGVKEWLKANHNCGSGEQDQFACVRSNADGGFGYLRLDLRRTQPIAKWQLEARLGGQVSTQQLVSAEQFALGGTDTVRGYLAAEGVGDDALLGSLQLDTPNLASAAAQGSTPTDGAWRRLQEARLYAFVDAGRARTIEPSAGQAAMQTLASVGLGFKLKAQHTTSLTFDAGYPLRAASVTQAHQLHVNSSLDIEF